MKWARQLPLVGLALLVASCGQQLDEDLLSLPGPGQTGDIVPGQYIFVLRDDVDVDSAVQALARTSGLTVLQTYTAALKGFAATVPAGRLAALTRDARIVSIEPDRVVAIASHKAGGSKAGGGSTSQPAQTTPTGVDRIDADLSSTQAGDGNNSVNVDIAIIDTGIQTNHPDLNVVGGRNCASGRSFNDGNGHGTHVAGIAAAKDDGFGVVGVAPGARLWAVRVLDNNGSGFLSWVICGVNWVTANANIIEVANMSLGFAGTSDALNTAIAKSVAGGNGVPGVTYVVAAGNSSKDAATFSPANHEDVIAVSAITDTDGQGGGQGPLSSWGGADRNGDGVDDGADDTFAWFSNFGSVVAIAAPGVDIRSTWKGSTYNTISGTSMASPHVAGAAALYKASNPSASPAAVKTALLAAGKLQSDPTFGFSGDPDASHEPLVYAGGL